MMKSIGVLILAASWVPQAAMAAGDATMGGRLFLQCRACHTVNEGEEDRVGPNLNDVVGRKAASRTGYTYSPAMVNSDLTWTVANLDAFLKKPSALVPGTKMTTAGVAEQQARDDLIAYLSTLKPAK